MSFVGVLAALVVVTIQLAIALSSILQIEFIVEFLLDKVFRNYNGTTVNRTCGVSTNQCTFSCGVVLAAVHIYEPIFGTHRPQRL